MKILECVPNFSEGQNPRFLDILASEVASIKDVRLLDYSQDQDHNRSVFTIIGSMEGVLEATLCMCNKAVQLIDMRQHNGVHPRIGAVDVVPFVPLGKATMDDAVAVAHHFGEIFGAENKIPIYYYGEASRLDGRQHLPTIRKGGYEGLAQKLQDPEWLPDNGIIAMNAKSGATAVGARMPLVAFNINLESNDIDDAKRIASAIREANGGLAGVRAIGLLLASAGVAQVSINIVDYRKTTLKQLFDRVNHEAQQAGVAIRNSELIGLVPKDAMGASAEYLRIDNFSQNRLLESYLDRFIADITSRKE
ncbi:MAG: glutamate formimidoyltransferase [Deltaproteobacteria bacterium]